MAHSIDAALRKKIAGALRNVLPDVKVEHGRFLTTESFGALFGALKKHERSGDLTSLMGERPLSDFAVGYLQQRLHESNEYEREEGPRKLTEYGAFSDVEGLANAILDGFASLPWRYTLSFVFPVSASTALRGIGQSVSISETQRMMFPEDSFMKLFPLDAGDKDKNLEIHRTGLLGYLDETPPAWDESKVVLQIETSGYIPHYGGGGTVDAATDALKSFCGLAIALHLFLVDRNAAGTGGAPLWYVHQKEADKWVIKSRFDVAPELIRAVQKLIPLSGGLSAEWLEKLPKRAMTGISIVSDAGSRAAKVLLAARWLFDGYTGHDNLLNFVQCMIVLETLLGDAAPTSEASLSAILASRLAYAIGETHAERQEIQDQFKKLYALRGAIVHRGQSRLSSSEWSQLQLLRQLCGRLIENEVTLLREGKKAEESKKGEDDTD